MDKIRVGIIGCGVGMMIKSWAAQIGHSGNGLVTSNGAASITSHGLRWKTHDMDSAKEFTTPIPDNETLMNSL